MSFGGEYYSSPPGQACQGVNSTNLGIIPYDRETPPGPVGLQAEPPTTACLHSISSCPGLPLLICL